MTRIRMFIASVLVVTSASLAHADAFGETRLSQVVKYGDLDLSRPQGAQTLYRRLQLAAKSVCAPLDGRELKRQTKFQNCMKEAIDTAVIDVDQPLLTQYHHSRDTLTVATAEVAQRE